jgi:hypothetical protein
VRLLPDTIRLLQSIARDRTLEKSIRVRLWLLFAYMAFPIDLVPDFIPVLGYGGRTRSRCFDVGYLLIVATLKRPC